MINRCPRRFHIPTDRRKNESGLHCWLKTQLSMVVVHAILILAVTSRTARPADATFGAIGFPSSDNAAYEAVALSADGETALLVTRCPEDRLWYCDDDGNIGEGYNYRSSIWTAESGVDPLGPVLAHDVSADGSVVVGGNLGDFEAFRWTPQRGVESLGTRNAARAVSGNGEVIVLGGLSSYFWTDDQGLVRLDARRELGERGTVDFDFASAVSADGSIVAGGTEFDPGNRMQAWRWTKETGVVAIPALPGSLQTHANGMTPDGRVIVGQSGIDDVLGGNGRFGFGQPFRWTESTGTEVLDGYDNGFRTYGVPTGVSADGSVIVGFAKEDTGRFGRDWLGEDDVAFVWDIDNGTRYLQDVLEDEFGLKEELSQWHLTRVDGISDDGMTLLGTGFNPAGRMEPWIVKLDSPLALWGDFDDNRVRSLDDLDLLVTAIVDGGSIDDFDVNTDGRLDSNDHSYWVEQLAKWRPGDADLDGSVSFPDFLLLSANFNSVGGWSRGDFDGNKQVDFGDFLILSTNYEVAHAATVSVPESNSPFALLAVLIYMRKRHWRASEN